MQFCWDASLPVAEASRAITAPSTITTTDRSLPALSTRTLEDTDDFICYLSKFNVIICKQHATAVQNLNTHLRIHHTLASNKKRIILERFQHRRNKGPEEIQLPAPFGLPIQELGEPVTGYQCGEDDCDYITINIKTLSKHCKKAHGLRWIGDTTLLYEKYNVQTFFRNGGLQRYFIVDTGGGSSHSAVPHDVVAVVKHQLTQWKATKETLEKKAQVLEAEIAKTDGTGWYSRTGWPKHFANRNLVHLAYQTRLPDRGEMKLKLVAELVEQLIERSVKGLSTLARETRRWLRSAHRKEPDSRPLARLQNPESQARYASYMVKFVCYLLRILADEDRRIQEFRDVNHDRDSECEDDSDLSDFSRSDGQESNRSNSDADSDDNYRPLRKKKKDKVDMMKDARELFRWEGEQHGLAVCFWDLLDEDPEDNREAQLDALLDLLTSFIFHKSGDEPFNSGLIHFLAVLGIDADMGRLRTAKNYSYMLAGVVYCVRVLSVEKLLPSSLREKSSDKDRDRFLKMRKQYLADGGYSPMSETISLLAYGKSVALASGNSGNAYWSKEKDIFYLNGRPIYISSFRSMAQDIVTETEAMLWQELLWVVRASDRFTIALERLVDDVTFTQRGASFLSKAENNLTVGLEWMLIQAQQSKEGCRLQSSDGKWKTKQVKQYLRRVNRFLEMLLLCVHMTSGQPGRGSEVTTMRHRNGSLQDRNIFVMDGQVMTVVRYHKSQSQWDKPKIVPRFLPPRLGQIMVVYLAYMQPFQEYLTVEVLGGSINDYVWADEQGPWGTDRLTRVLKRETGKRLGVELRTLDYRHTAVGIGRVVVGESFSKGYQDEVGEVEEAEVDEDLVELQNARSTAMGVGNYSVPIDIVRDLSIRSIDAFRPLSTLWHHFLGLGEGKENQEAWSRSGTTKKRLERNDEDLGSDQRLVVRPRNARTVDSREEVVRRAMQQVLGQEEVGFRSIQQEQAIYAVLQGQTPLVVVLPTGGGKSLLFTVPACVEDGVTIVVVPYRALITDLVTRIQACGIHCIEWKHGESNPASIVVVSADVAGDLTSNGNFISYAGILNSKGMLRRVVIDECHLIFTASDWRPKLALLRHLRLLPCPFVLLTATLPPIQEGELDRSMMIRCAVYIRASTVRPNTRYFVSWCERGEIEKTALVMCERQQQLLLHRGEKGVVYCRGKQQCDDIAEALGCVSYHADVPDRAVRLEEWHRQGGLIVATSALGTGVDYPGILYILHVGMPWSMIDYAQESGRGGRGGERVDSVILVERGEVERIMQQKSGEMDVQAMGRFLIGSGCRRGLMSSYLDRQQINCNDIDSAGCDRCGEGVREVLDEQVKWSREWQTVREMMDELRHGCAICWVLGRDVEDQQGKWREHRTMQCSEYSGANRRDVDAFRRKVCDGGGIHSCRRCWVSQKYCATGEDVKNQCQWPNVVMPVVFAAVGFGDGVEVIRKCGYKGESIEEYAKWLGLRYRERVWGEFFSNAMVVAVQVVLQFSRVSLRDE